MTVYNDGIDNEFEEAHQKGLKRGFDLGWSYKGRFDRSIIRDRIQKMTEELEEHLKEGPREDDFNPNADVEWLNLTRVQVLNSILKELENHDNNREFIT